MITQKFTDANVHLTQKEKKKAFIKTYRIIFVQISGHCGLAKLTHKINHHRGYFKDWLYFCALTKM